MNSNACTARWSFSARDNMAGKSHPQSGSDPGSLSHGPYSCLFITITGEYTSTYGIDLADVATERCSGGYMVLSSWNTLSSSRY